MIKFFYILVLISEMCILVFWGLNSELTEMQIFIKFWYIHIINLIFLGVSFLMGANHDT